MVRLVFGIAMAMLALNALVPIHSINQMIDTNAAKRRSAAVLDSLDQLAVNVLEAETRARGYALSGDTLFLAPYSKATESAQIHLRELADALGDVPDQVKLQQRLAGQIEHVEATALAILTARHAGSLTTAMTMQLMSASRQQLDLVRASIAEMRGAEMQRRRQLDATESAQMSFSRLSLGALTVLDFLLFAAAYYLISRTGRAWARTQADLRAMHDQASLANQDLEQRNADMEVLSRMMNALQSTVDAEESYAAVGKFCAQLFSSNAGALYILRPSKDIFERAATWGEPMSHGDLFEPEQCWAIRKGNQHRVDSTRSDLICRHMADTQPADLPYLCVPLAAHGETLGLLCLEGAAAGEGRERQPVSTAIGKLAVTTAEQIGLAVANLRLRETLRHNAIVDALTGIYNRRYLDETLRRELLRADRKDTAVGVILLDIDHFKRFNDTYGHEAGDLVLRHVGQELKRRTRSSDVACRYGGEEFLLLLPEATEAACLERAEAIRLGMQNLNVQYGGQHLGQITASLGVAVFPKHGGDSDALLRAADNALYYAKHSGRNRVVLAGDTMPAANQ